MNQMLPDIASDFRLESNVPPLERSSSLSFLDTQSLLRYGRGESRLNPDRSHRPRDDDANDPLVEIFPSNGVGRSRTNWPGITGEVIESSSVHETEFSFRGSAHLLVMYDRALRRRGESFVEGLPRSNLRDLTRKLTFVPAGHEYREWHDPRVPTRLAYFYFDPVRLPIQPELGFADMLFSPRLFFEDATLSHTANKLRSLIRCSDPNNRLYGEALGIVLAHELARLNAQPSCTESPVRGGLAAWQRKVAMDYIESNLSKQISLATLARLARLSPHYFCRAFKQSFQIPPHRYHSGRRIEHAKTLLANSTLSVTEIGLRLGFSETSSFTAAFRKGTGITPTGYRRSVA